MNETTGTEEAIVFVVDYPPEIQFGCNRCEKCGRTIQEGQYAIGVKIGERKYLAGESQPPECCGELKSMPFLFASKQEAEAKAKDVESKFDPESGTFRGVTLYQWAQFMFFY